MAKFEEGLRYSESHEYIRVEGEYGYIGISDYAVTLVSLTMPSTRSATWFTSTCLRWTTR